MSAMLEIRDEGATGKLVQSFLLELTWDVTTVREVLTDPSIVRQIQS